MKILNILLVTRGQQRKGTFKVVQQWIPTFSIYILLCKVNESCNPPPAQKSEHINMHRNFCKQF